MMYSDHGLPSLISSQILPPSSSIQVLTSPASLVNKLRLQFCILGMFKPNTDLLRHFRHGEEKGRAWE